MSPIEQMEFRGLVIPRKSHAETLDDFLLAQGDRWTTAAEIELAIGLNERETRMLASGNLMIVSGPGCPGYRHMSNCRMCHVHEAAERLKSQARSMTRKANQLINRAQSILMS